MRVRHDTKLLERAVEHVVQRASIPIRQAEAELARANARATAQRRLASGIAIAVAALGIGLGIMFGLWGPHSVIAHGSIVQWLGESGEKQVSHFEPSGLAAAGPIVPASRTLGGRSVVINFDKFATAKMDLLGRTWEINAGHHFASESDVKWNHAWCYTEATMDGILVRVDLAQRSSPDAEPGPLEASSETLAKAGLDGKSALSMAASCPWLDGKTFRVNQSGSSSNLPAETNEGFRVNQSRGTPPLSPVSEQVRNETPTPPHETEAPLAAQSRSLSSSEGNGRFLYETATVDLLGKAWKVVASHQFGKSGDLNWTYGWCYTDVTVDGVRQKVDLSTASRRDLLESSPEILRKAGLDNASAKVLMANCPWLDRRSVADETPPLPPQPVAPPPLVPQPPPRPVAAQPPPLEQHQFDLTDISRLLSHDAPSQLPSNHDFGNPDQSQLSGSESLARWSDPDYLAGNRAFGLGNFDEAISHLSDFLRRQPREVSGYRLRGLAYEGKHMFKAAMADYSDAYFLGDSELNLDRVKKALAVNPIAVNQPPAIADPSTTEKMPPEMWESLDQILEEQFKQCWYKPGPSPAASEEGHYVPAIQVLFGDDGRLIGDPVLTNPSPVPGDRMQSEAALQAVRRCNPLKIPALYAPYHDEWKERVLRFDPADDLANTSQIMGRNKTAASARHPCSDIPKEYYSALSGEDDSASAYLRNAYSRQVAYNGNVVRSSDLVEAKTTILHALKNRQYVITSQSDMALTSDSCKSLRTMRWIAQDKLGHVKRGVSEFSFTVATDGSARILAQTETSVGQNE